MQDSPSLTAKNVALLRAAHQLMEGGAIFPDPLAVSISCESVNAISRFAQEHPEFNRLRLFTVARSRFAEDCLACAVDRGLRQVVVLGAGLVILSASAIPTRKRDCACLRSTAAQLSSGSGNAWPGQTSRFPTG